MINGGSFIHTMEHFLSDIFHSFGTERGKKLKIRILEAKVDKRRGRNVSSIKTKRVNIKKNVVKGW